MRLVQAIQRGGPGGASLGALGATLVHAPADPAAAAARLDSLAGSAFASDSAGIARALLRGLAAEWTGEAGDPAGASLALAGAVWMAWVGGDVERSNAQAPGPLQRLLQAELSRIPAKAGIYVKHLKTGEEAAVLPDERFNSASVIKIPMIASGGLALSRYSASAVLVAFIVACIAFSKHRPATASH